MSNKATSFLFLMLLMVFGGCAQHTPKKTYLVAIDPTFFPLQVGEGRGDLLGFIGEVLEEIGKKQKVHFVRVSVSWDILLEGLCQKKYEGAFSTAPPNVINSAKYSFSDLLLLTGPVLITQISDKKTTLSTLNGKVVGMEKNEISLELLSKYPEVIPEFYDSIPLALENTASGKYTASLVPVLKGATYVRDLYSKRLSISSSVFSDEAIRLLTCSGDAPALLTAFNEGLAELKSSGIFDKLLTKWNIPKETAI